MSIDYLAEEIIAEILLRLPVKSLIKCRRVCKLWNSRIKTCPFIDTHLSRSLLIEADHYNRNDGHPLFPVLQSEQSEDTYHPSYYAEYCIVLLKPPILDDPLRVLVIFGTCNVLMCLAPEYGRYMETAAMIAAIIIWNPSIRKQVNLPLPPNIERAWTNLFGHGCRANDYKVASNNVLANGALHWVLPRDRNGEKYTIVTFDLSTELFREISSGKIRFKTVH